METVSFYSYKGGVGRTLLVANTAEFLALSGRRVVALDLDLEAPGLHLKLRSQTTRIKSGQRQLAGAVDVLLATLSAKTSTWRLRDVAVHVELPSPSTGALILIPAGAAPSDAYWESLEQLNVMLRKEQHGSLPEAVLELQARIAEELSPDFLLIDSRTGITELGGLATSLLADRVVCLSTTAPESIEGTRVVAEALRHAPRLPSQHAIRLEFVVSRVAEGSRRSESITRLEKNLGDSVALLPHDQGIADEERVLSDWRPAESDRYDERDDAGTSLFTATLKWIATAFPGHKEEAEVARRRMEAVHRAWRYLTRTTERVGRGTSSRAAWPVEQLRERVWFGQRGETRHADIVVYPKSARPESIEPLMVIEYVSSEDRDAVARWWFKETKTRVVVILSEQADRRIYSHRIVWDSDSRHSERWDIPMPHDFEALEDPTDVSVDSLLDAVRRGHTEYLDRIVAEWVRSSAAGLHGGAPWRPRRAKRIVDGLARVDGPELGARVLWRIAFAKERGSSMWLGDGDEYLQEQVIEELFAPLFWRLPPEASIQLLEGRGRPFGPPTGLAAVALLARDLLGLQYDPDKFFRSEGQRILESRSSANHETDDDRSLYELAPAFRRMEISFTTSEDHPPIVIKEVEAASKEQEFTNPLDMIAEMIAKRGLVLTGLLGNYESESGTVVLYSKVIQECAERLALRPRHVGSIMLILGTIHALSHVGRDLDGRIWEAFALPPPRWLTLEISSFHETLAQYFTFQHLSRLEDPALSKAFERLTQCQLPAYRAWRRIRHLPLEDVRSWFLGIRRGVGPAPIGVQWLSNVSEDD